jgi:hypothetical protein
MVIERKRIMKIDWSTYLEKDTVISVNDKIGKIVEAETVKDQFGKPIVVHTVRLTHKINYCKALTKYIFIPLSKVRETQPNYSFIQVVVDEKLKQAYESKIQIS